MLRSLRSALLAGLCSATLAACSLTLTACSGEDDGTGPDAHHGDFAVTISAGTQPSYSWDVGGAFSVSVVRTSAPGTIVWGIANPFTRDIASPLRHGAVPQGTVESAATEKTLTGGVEYRVSVTLADGRTGWNEFRP